MAQYRKKPVVIEAVAWYGKYTDGTEWPDWFRNAVDSQKIYPQRELPCPLMIDTSEGEMRADIGDYVIRGIKGELYPCKPDIFAATYESV